MFWVGGAVWFYSVVLYIFRYGSFCGLKVGILGTSTRDYKTGPFQSTCLPDSNIKQCLSHNFSVAIYYQRIIAKDAYIYFVM